HALRPGARTSASGPGVVLQVSTQWLERRHARTNQQIQAGTETVGSPRGSFQMDQIELTDGIVSIRKYREGDAELLYRAVRESISEISPWLPWCHEGYSIEESRDFVATRNIRSQGDEWYSFAVLDQSCGRFLGGVGINFINRVHQFANLGYWVRTSAAVRGVATRASKLDARFCFQE